MSNDFEVSVQIIQSGLIEFRKCIRIFLHLNATAMSLSAYFSPLPAGRSSAARTGCGLAPPTLIVSRILIASNFFQLHTSTQLIAAVRSSLATPDWPAPGCKSISKGAPRPKPTFSPFCIFSLKRLLKPTAAHPSWPTSIPRPRRPPAPRALQSLARAIQSSR